MGLWINNCVCKSDGIMDYGFMDYENYNCESKSKSDGIIMDYNRVCVCASKNFSFLCLVMRIASYFCLAGMFVFVVLLWIYIYVLVDELSMTTTHDSTTNSAQQSNGLQ
jgi:hypothetical protein